MAIHKILEQFANNTQQHVLPKIIRSRSPRGRVMWSFIFILTTIIFVWQLSIILLRYTSYPKSTHFGEATSPAPFPAISLCNMRHLDETIMNTINDLFLKNHDPRTFLNHTDPFIKEYMTLVSKITPLWYKYQSTHPKDFENLISGMSLNFLRQTVIESGVQLREFLVDCRFKGDYCAMSDFKHFFDPHHYNCYTYTPKSGHTVLDGAKYGLSAILFTGSGLLYENEELRIVPGFTTMNRHVTGGEGVRIVVHPPGTEPFPLTEGYDVPSGFSASIGVKTIIKSRLSYPYGNCINENPFASYGSYRRISCLKRCLQHHVVKQCGCYDDSLPKLNEVPSCRDVSKIPDSCMDEATVECFDEFLKVSNSTQCAFDVHKTVDRNPAMLSECKCHHPCNEIEYDISYSLSKWPASGPELDQAYFDIFYIEEFRNRFIDDAKFEGINKLFNDSDRATAMQEFSRMTLYKRDGTAVLTYEAPDYLITDLLSDIGGQMALWVGVSIVTLAEVLELAVKITRYVFFRRPKSEARPSIVSTESCNAPLTPMV